MAAAAQTVPAWRDIWTYMVAVVVVVVAVVVFDVGELVTVVTGERVLGEQNDDFDFDGLPGVQHEFKVHIPARAEDCYFQKAKKGATVYVAFEVLRGGDHNVNMMVRNSQGQVIQAFHWANVGTAEFVAEADDTYVVCVDNSDSGFSEKLVYLYLVVFVMDDWTNFSKEMEGIHIFAENASKALANVEQSVNNMRKSQSQIRFHLSRDLYLAHGNRRYVQIWSLLQCVLIIAASIGQVFFVRRLFRTVNVTPTSKPRA